MSGNKQLVSNSIIQISDLIAALKESGYRIVQNRTAGLIAIKARHWDSDKDVEVEVALDSDTIRVHTKHNKNCVKTIGNLIQRLRDQGVEITKVSGMPKSSPGLLVSDETGLPPAGEAQHELGS
jgi:hypothetical protein